MGWPVVVTKPKSPSDRKAAERKRKRDAGFVPVEVWIKEGKKRELAYVVKAINSTHKPLMLI